MISRIETIINTLVTEYGSITTANGYRNDLAGKVVHGIKPFNAITRPVEVGIDFNAEPIETENGDSFESHVETFVEARIQVGTNEAANFTLTESVLHDLKKCTASLVKKYLRTTGNYWNIDVAKPITAYRDMVEIPNKPIRVVGVRFTIHVRNLDESFT